MLHEKLVKRDIDQLSSPSETFIKSDPFYTGGGTAILAVSSFVLYSIKNIIASCCKRSI